MVEVFVAQVERAVVWASCVDWVHCRQRECALRQICEMKWTNLFDVFVTEAIHLESWQRLVDSRASFCLGSLNTSHGITIDKNRHKHCIARN